MIFKKFVRFFYVKPSIYENRVNTYTVTKLKKHQWLKEFVLKREIAQTMSSVFRFRMILRDLSLKWTRNLLVSAVVRRCRRDGVREVLQCFRQTILRPRRTLLLSATAACKTSQDEDETPKNDITDEELTALTSEMEEVEELVRSTLYCTECGKRLAIDKKQPGISYCGCKSSAPKSSADGWEPFLEAEDVVIWRRQYKGPGFYAYKVYGHYREVCARDFAAVQLDTAYRRQWDPAVADLSVLQQAVNGRGDQSLLHWEVLWPRMFANRDYVYLRRHREFEVSTGPGRTAEDSLLRGLPAGGGQAAPEERLTVHSRARRRVLEAEARGRAGGGGAPGRGARGRRTVFVMLSRSCQSERAPPGKHALRVTEYWSQMVVRSLDGDDRPGMEFVLTYYDEPGVGGMPAGVAGWAAGRAAPQYLADMRRAARQPRPGTQGQRPPPAPAAAPAAGQRPPPAPAAAPAAGQRPPPAPAAAPAAGQRPSQISERDMESSKRGPELDVERSPVEPSQTAARAQRSPVEPSEAPSPPAEQTGAGQAEKSKGNDNGLSEAEAKTDGDVTAEDEEKNGGWWSYLYPFYYFV